MNEKNEQDQLLSSILSFLNKEIKQTSNNIPKENYKFA